MIKNIFYFDHINTIGGVENFFYELAKKYKDKDIVIYYSSGDKKQIERLQKYVKVVKYNGEKIKCEKAFFNYRANIIDNVEAKEYYMIIHADYKVQGIEPPQYSKITNYIGVSQAVCDSFTELTGYPCKLCYNPITLDPPIKTLKLVSATRLTKEKGKHRMEKFADILTKANIPFEWTVYTNSRETINNPNVKYVEPTLEINGKLKEADYVVQLSDSESYCYTMIEALMLGVPIIVTPWPCLKELNIDDKYGFILPFDMKDIPVKEIYEKEFNFKYEPPMDCWDEILSPGNSQYQLELNSLYKVMANEEYSKRKCTDIELGYIPKAGETWIVSKERYDILNGGNKKNIKYIDLIEIIKPKQKTIEKPIAQSEAIKPTKPVMKKYKILNKESL